MTLTDFLMARIAEDEERAREAMAPEPHYLHFGDTAADAMLGLAESEGADTFALLHFGRYRPARVLAECEAKRRIVEILSFRPPLSAGEWARLVRFDMLVALALPYADHPDYDESWRP